MKTEFIELLRSTQRHGVDNVIEKLDKAGFFNAPASVNRHLNIPGGLLQHSMNVCKVALKLWEVMKEMKPGLEERVPRESVIIASLLHDVCKSNIYKIAQKWRKNDQGQWETYNTYEVDYSRLPLGHGEKSVIILLRLGLELTNEEILAIRWHMGAWDLAFQSYEMKNNISEAGEKFPLVSIIQAADGLSAHLLEVDKV